jgi:diaminopimelate epimerase
VASGGRDYTVRRAPSTPEGVRQVLLELPAVRFAAPPPAPFGGFTAVTVPNPHVVAVVAEYSEPGLIEAGKRADEVFPDGANVSFLLPLDAGTTTSTSAPLAPPASSASADPEVFVRTFERGAGLTPSCGSGVVASRAVYSRVTGLDPGQRLVVRNAGGVAAASIRVRDGAWLPVLEGNATIVYEAEVDLDGRQAGPVEYAAGENAAYATLDAENTAHLKSAGVTTAHP